MGRKDKIPRDMMERKDSYLELKRRRKNMKKKKKLSKKKSVRKKFTIKKEKRKADTPTFSNPTSTAKPKNSTNSKIMEVIEKFSKKKLESEKLLKLSFPTYHHGRQNLIDIYKESPGR